VKVLIASSDHVGSSMAGPGIRYLRFAEELSRRFEVTLSVPYETDLEPRDFAVVRANPYDAGEMNALTRRFDAVVAQRLPVPTLRALARSSIRTVYDLYAPYTIENLALDGGRAAGKVDRASHRLHAVVQNGVLRLGDAFICASETQRDLWLGALLALGRVDHEAYQRDPTLRDVIDVVPFGVEPVPPVPGPAMRGVIPGIDERSRILLWPGGVWNWFDPLTLIRAVAELRRGGEDVWLVFLGIRHPNPRVPAMAMTQRALDLSQSLGLTGRGVHFNESWVPYDARGAWLLEADLGVSAHQDDLEARFAFRTRLLDCFWAGLPVVTTGGDALARLVSERDIGRVVPPGDEAAWVAAVSGLLASPETMAGMRTGLAQVRDELAWPRVVEPLARLVAGPARGTGHRVDTTLAAYGSRRIGFALASRGIAGSVRRLAGLMAEQISPRPGAVAKGRSLTSGGEQSPNE
jgi:glycosyltransferase involved in cell wall biosynthesis